NFSGPGLRKRDLTYHQSSGKIHEECELEAHRKSGIQLYKSNDSWETLLMLEQNNDRQKETIEGTRMFKLRKRERGRLKLGDMQCKEFNDTRGSLTLSSKQKDIRSRV